MIKDCLYVRDTTYEYLLSHSCWKVVAATYDNTPTRYIGGKIVHQYKEVLFKFRGNFEIMYEYYDLWQSGKKEYKLKTIHFLPRERIHYCSKDKLVIYNFEEWWHKRGNYFVLEPASLEHIEKWENGYKAYEEYQRQLEETILPGEVVFTDNMDISRDYEKMLLDAIIRENGLDRELALKCYYMNIQRDMSFRPKISETVATPPLQPIAAMRAEIMKAKPRRQNRR